MGTAPTPGRGLILELNELATGIRYLDPHAHGASMEATPSAAIAYHVTNNGPTGPLVLDFHYLPKEL